MRPLVYLTTRTILNGLKRSLKSARRLISLVALVFWYFLAFLRPFDRAGRFPGSSPTLPFAPLSHTVIEALVFGVFAALSLLLMMGVFSYRGQFRPSDIDVLFATPVSPRLVLIFRIFRDYLLTLFLPLFLAIFFYRPAAANVASFIASNPDTARFLTKVSTIAWVLIALFWVCGGYAASLWVNRSDLVSERNRKLLGWGVAALILVTMGYIIYRIRGMESLSELPSLAQSTFLRAVFFTAWLASQMVIGTLTGSIGTTFLAAGALIGAILIALTGAFRQVGWMYDQAASRGTDAQTLRSLQRQGDMIGVMAEQARRGKIKVRRDKWLHRMRVKGMWALVWKETIIVTRSTASSFYLLVPVVIGMMIMPVIGLSSAGPRVDKVIGPIFLGMVGFGVFMISLTLSQSGFIEMLRRVDLQKPLPFGSAQIVISEVIAKVIPATLVCWLGIVITVGIRPGLWQEAGAGIIGVPFGATLICEVVLLMTVLFPDVDDPTQRGFRGLMTMLGIAVAGGPCIAVYALLASFTSPIIGAFIAAALAAGISTGVAAIAGGLYASYNPSE